MAASTTEPGAQGPTRRLGLLYAALACLIAFAGAAWWSWRYAAYPTPLCPPNPGHSGSGSRPPSKRTLSAAFGSKYQFQAGKFHNLRSDDFIVDPQGGDAHGMVFVPEVAWAISRAVVS